VQTQRKKQLKQVGVPSQKKPNRSWAPKCKAEKPAG